MSFVAVLPSIWPPYTAECLSTCRLDPLVIDNTVENRGVSASWDLGVDQMYGKGADWLVIISAAMRFGAAGGLDLIEQLPDHPDAWAVEAGDGIGWHLIAFPRRAFDAVGHFDAGFFSYYGDNDFATRIKFHAGLTPPFWPKVSVDCSLASVAHGIKMGGAFYDGPEAHERYVRKWGGEPGQEIYRTPWGLDVPLSWWPEQVFA